MKIKTKILVNPGPALESEGEFTAILNDKSN